MASSLLLLIICSLPPPLSLSLTHTHTHTHTYLVRILLYSSGEMVAVSSLLLRLEVVSLSSARKPTEVSGRVSVAECEGKGEADREREGGIKLLSSVRATSRSIPLTSESLEMISRCTFEG